MSIMEPKELRLGNLLMWEDDSKEIISVTGILKRKNYYSVSFEGGAAQLDEFIPVTLTDEQIAIFGFTSKEKGKFILSVNDYNYVLTRDWHEEPSYHFGIEYTDAPDPKDDYVVHNFAWDIKYAHQLQNLFFAAQHEELMDYIKRY